MAIKVLKSFIVEERSKIDLKKLIKKNKKIFRNFLEDFLFKYYCFLKINSVIGAAIHYRQDIDWGEVSSRIGVPYIVLHKENLYAAEGYIKQFKIANKYREKFIKDLMFLYTIILSKKHGLKVT